MEDAGPLPSSPPSTVVDFGAEGMPVIVREGSIGREMVLKAAAKESGFIQ